MPNLNLPKLRLRAQAIADARFNTPGEAVAWLGAVQAQDYLGALWAIGLRTRKAAEADVEKALAERTIVRTWPMRRTLHFVAAEDVRWMLELLTPRMVSGMAGRMRQHFGLDEMVFGRCSELLVRALEGGKQLARPAMYEVLEAGGISTGEMRGLHILSWLAQEGTICFGARQGKQQTFALLDEWVPSAKRLEREEALMEIARRYFISHGPATLQDFIWWTGLTATDAKAALEMAKPQLVKEVIEGQSCWLASSQPATKGKPPRAFLLPPYDEYTVAYKDRSAVLNPRYTKQSGSGIFYPIIVIDGKVTGTWKRIIKKDTVSIALRPFERSSKADSHAIAEAAECYGNFIGTSVKLQ